MSRLTAMSLLSLLILALAVRGDDKDAGALVKKVVQAAGGEDKLLRLFRIRESLNVSSDATKKGKERVSVFEPPRYWWMNKRERVADDKEPATFLVWAWTLGALTDARSKVEVVPGVTEQDMATFGLRVSATISPAMDLYFDQETNRLVRIDWRSDIHRFSDYKEHDGVRYPARCVGYRKSTNQPWYFTEILELERLKELPPGLKR